MDVDMELEGFSTSNKVKSHWSGNKTMKILFQQNNENIAPTVFLKNRQ